MLDKSNAKIKMATPKIQRDDDIVDPSFDFAVAKVVMMIPTETIETAMILERVYVFLRNKYDMIKLTIKPADLNII
jgi:hypothetical protein